MTEQKISHARPSRHISAPSLLNYLPDVRHTAARQFSRDFAADLRPRRHSVFSLGASQACGKKAGCLLCRLFCLSSKQRHHHHHHHHQQQQQHIRESTTNCDYTVDSLEPRPSSPAVIRCRRSYSWVWSVQSAVKICTASVLTSSVTVQRRPRTGVGTMKLNRWVSNIEKENWQPSTLHNSFHDKPCPDSSRCHLVQEPYHPPTKTSPNYLEHT